MVIYVKKLAPICPALSSFLYLQKRLLGKGVKIGDITIAKWAPKAVQSTKIIQC
jgi:hypothetical protein